jgi:hypothetical protein
MLFLIDMPLKLQTGSLQLTQGGNWRRSKTYVAVDKRPIL